VFGAVQFFRHLPTVLKKMPSSSAQQQVTTTLLYTSNRLRDCTPQKTGLTIAMFVTASNFQYFLVTDLQNNKVQSPPSVFISLKHKKNVLLAL